MKKWTDLPEELRLDEVRKYYSALQQHRAGLFCKRIFDLLAAGILLIVLTPLLIILSVLIRLDSKGPVMFRQVRVTTYGKEFRIFKFRTMVNDADKMGTQVTTKGDMRVTRIGRFLRGSRLDELPQLFNILKGEMTFVGTRPEVPRYVACYTNEMKATLLLPAGVTSRASIEYKDEESLLEHAEDADEVYVNQVLPEKMKYNLQAVENFSFWGDVKTMFDTVVAVVR